MPNKPQSFRPPHQRTHAQAQEEYDRRRGSARERGYTAAWDRAAVAFKSAHPLCLGCQAVGRVAACEVVDHVVPHDGDQVRFWDRSNWQPACTWCHSVLKQQIELAYRKGQLSADYLGLDSEAALVLRRTLRPPEGEGGQISGATARGPAP